MKIVQIDFLQIQETESQKIMKSLRGLYARWSGINATQEKLKLEIDRLATELKIPTHEISGDLGGLAKEQSSI